MIFMEKRIHLSIGTVFILILGVLLGALLLRSKAPQEIPATPYEAVLVGTDISIPVTVADTEDEREQGLSGTVSLPENTGKLFIFDAPGQYGFWMKDMLFPIDIIWLSHDLLVVDITPNLTPDTYPQGFYPHTDAQFVLEVNSGFASRFNIEIGQKFILQK
jgi:uncharacterized membrane protein (UPF0127 family)